MELTQIHNYWKHPDDHNSPINYLEGDKKSEFLLGVIRKYAKPEDKILEIGCNVGRNLNKLYTNGFKNLEGIDINEKALILLKRCYPEMQIKTYCSPVEDIIKKLGKYDVIFTMAVLEHIHTDSVWIFKEIQKRAKTLITIEDEGGISWRHFSRNYKHIFSGQVEEIPINEVEGFDNRYFKARIFK